MKDFTFYDNVCDVVRLVPEGRVTTYGAIANYLGSVKSARMVGWVLNASKIKKNIPAHRVVNKSGILSGKNHFSSPFEMERLLEKEGVFINKDQVINFQKVFWDPVIELNI